MWIVIFRSAKDGDIYEVETNNVEATKIELEKAGHEVLEVVPANVDGRE